MPNASVKRIINKKKDKLISDNTLIEKSGFKVKNEKNFSF